MSEQINKVLASTAQAFSTAEQKQARDNIDAQKSISYSYSGSNITAIDGSAIAQSGALTYVTHDSNLTGSGTTDSPLGLSSTVNLSSGPYSAEYNPYEVNFHNADGYGLYNYNVMRLSSTGGGDFSINDAGLTSRDIGDISTTVSPTGVFIDEHNGGDADLTLEHNKITFSERYSDSQVVDRSSIERWNSYSSLSGFTGCSANNCISGDGTSGSPLGLSSKVRLENSYSALELQPNYILVNNHVGSSQIGNSYVTLTTPLAGSATAHMNASALRFTDSSNHTAQVDISSIDKWNSNVWDESGNPLSTGFGGNKVTAASQYNYGAGNWAARTVKMSGLPDQTMYGFQSRPQGNGTYGINQAGAFVQIPQQNYFVYLFHQTGDTMETLDTSFYPTGLTADARLDFVNLCSGCSANIKTDTFHGNTANFNPGESATMWYIATADIWTDGANPVPV